MRKHIGNIIIVICIILTYRIIIFTVNQNFDSHNVVRRKYNSTITTRKITYDGRSRNREMVMTRITDSCIGNKNVIYVSKPRLPNFGANFIYLTHQHFNQISQERKFSNATILVFSINAKNYNMFHWCMKMLQLFNYNQIYQNRTGSEDIVILFEGNITNWQASMLHLIQNSHKTLDKNEYTQYCYRNMIVFGVNYLFFYNNVIWNQFKNKVNILVNHCNNFDVIDVLILNRETNRVILNTKEMSSVLMKYKIEFKIVKFTKLTSFHDQVCYFRKSKIVLSPHGNGLTNIIFLDNNNTVIELFAHKSDKRSNYRDLANYLNITYYAIYDNNHRNRALHYNYNSNIIVNLEKLYEIIKNILG